MKYIIANWKANKTVDEAIAWCDTFSEKLQYGNHALQYLHENKIAIIIAPPFPLIPIVKSKMSSIPNIFMAAQSVSDIENGSFTGEVPAATLKGLVSYALIGHSERRTHYNETNEIVTKKATLALKQLLNPIVCVRTIQDTIDENIQLVAYEPTWAIGSGKNESLEAVLEMKNVLKIQAPRKFIYGGSVTEDNCASYLQTDQIDGVLIGSASLDPARFYSIISQI